MINTVKYNLWNILLTIIPPHLSINNLINFVTSENIIHKHNTLTTEINSQSLFKTVKLD
jgi:hypothetical protein